MNGVTITMLPTLCAPQMLNKKELVEQVNYLQDAILRQGQTLNDVSSKLGEMCLLANTLSSQLYALIDSFDANDREAITLQLRQMSERRKLFEQQKERVH
jgi:hypothetical protein